MHICEEFLYDHVCAINIVLSSHKHICILVARPISVNKIQPFHKSWSHMYTIIEDMSSVRIFILETDVVCLVLHDCLDWQGHHPSHSVSVNTQCHDIMQYNHFHSPYTHLFGMTLLWLYEHLNNYTPES